MNERTTGKKCPVSRADQLTAALAERVMGWTVGPDRFLTGNREWMPRWKFRPFEKIEDAFRLLAQAAPQEYNIRGDGKGNVCVRVALQGAEGEAQGTSASSVITFAVARAVGIEAEP